MKWLMLALAGLFEITWACSMKYSEGFSKIVPTLITVIAYLASALFLSLAMKKMPLGTAYAIWTGVGIAGTSLLGIFLFHEKASLPQMICVILIIIGITGLKLFAEE
ncbi:MAG: multidrug efflux SMR transporter [Proteobacteria bacterium]|nr:multidrug efflux SMR transporter [Pseudomonadota bacterium]